MCKTNHYWCQKNNEKYRRLIPKPGNKQLCSTSIQLYSAKNHRLCLTRYPFDLTPLTNRDIISSMQNLI